MKPEQEMDLRQLLRSGILPPRDVKDALIRLGMTAEEAERVILWDLIEILWYKVFGKEE